MKSTFSEPILQTKIYKPLVKNRYIIRQSIIDYLEENRHNPLTLVVAATGYGKSVTVSEWLDQTKAKYCWLSLDDEFNDVHTFFLYLIHAIRSVFPNTLSHLHDLLHGSEIPPHKVLIKYLINGLDETDQEIIVVLDDYHSIHNNQIHEIINGLLKNTLPNLHLVIISRHDPPLDLSVLNSFGDINELRMAALSFTRDEIVTLAERILNIRISEKLADILLQKTEGWIVGLRMALMQVAVNKDIEKALEGLNVDQQYFSQYLLKEVFQQQPEPVRKLLLTASISERFCRGLLAAVSGKDNENTVYPDAALFDQLISSGMFIIPLDGEGEWYRFHHLFHDFLSEQLEKEHTKEQIIEYHKRASLFFEENRSFEDAIHHALKSDDVDRVAQIFERYKHKLMDTDQFTRLEKWLHLVPEAIIETQPQILLTRAFLYDATANYTAMQRDLSLAEPFFTEIIADNTPGKTLWGEFHTVKACLSYLSGNVDTALYHSKKALELLPSSPSYMRVFALSYRSISLQTSGQTKKAKTLLKECLDMLPLHSDDRIRILVVQSIFNAHEGNLSEILDATLECRPLFLQKELHVSFVFTIYYISVVYYLRNELDIAAETVDELQEYYYTGRPFWVLNCLFVEGFALQAQGKFTELETALQRTHTFANNYDHQQMKQLTKAFEVELALRQDDIEKAHKLSKSANFEIYPPVFFFYFPQLTQIKLLMSLGDSDKIIEATTRLEQLIEFGRSMHRKNLLIHALPLQALFYRNAGDEESAIKTLSEALILSKPGGHIRNFLDLGKPMQEMVKALYRRKPDDVYLTKIDKAFEREQALIGKNTLKKSEALPNSPAADIEKITRRELELLQLVAEGYQNKEIAEKLFVAPDSIKKSLYRLYQKLNVKNRTSAVSIAVKMGLINPANERE